MEEKNLEIVDLFSFPEGYEKAKELLGPIPEGVKDGLLYGLGRTII